MGIEDSKWLDVIADLAVGAWACLLTEGLLDMSRSWIVLGNKAACKGP